MANCSIEHTDKNTRTSTAPSAPQQLTNDDPTMLATHRKPIYGELYLKFKSPQPNMYYSCYSAQFDFCKNYVRMTVITIAITIILNTRRYSYEVIKMYVIVIHISLRIIHVTRICSYTFKCSINTYPLFRYVGTVRTNLSIGLTDSLITDQPDAIGYTLCYTGSTYQYTDTYLVYCQSSCVVGRYLFIQWDQKASQKLNLVEVQVYTGIKHSLLT